MTVSEQQETKEPRSGVFQDPRRHQTVVMLDDEIVGAVCWEAHPQVQRQWYKRIIETLTPEQLVKVLSPWPASVVSSVPNAPPAPLPPTSHPQG